MISSGPNEHEGRLNIYMHGIWGSVCEDLFDDIDASVACRQLGYWYVWISDVICISVHEDSLISIWNSVISFWKLYTWCITEIILQFDNESLCSLFNICLYRLPVAFWMKIFQTTLPFRVWFNTCFHDVSSAFASDPADCFSSSNNFIKWVKWRILQS